MKKKKGILIGAVVLFLIVAIIAIIWLRQKIAVEKEQTPEYMVEIRVENGTNYLFENLKFGIVVANDNVLEDIDFEETDENVASFWVGYTDTTEFYVKLIRQVVLLKLLLM